jgi:hypothetical protein
MVQRLHARGIRVIVYDPDPVPPDFYQWDGIHFNAAAHAKIAATLAVQITATIKPSAIAPDSDAPNAAPANMAPATTDSPNTPPARTTPSPSKP